jgi:hypothetical protein
MKKLELNQMASIEGGGSDADPLDSAAATVIGGALAFGALTFLSAGAFTFAEASISNVMKGKHDTVKNTIN